jgi:hypothetical protein
MSLNAWSYPFYDENPIEKRATSRKKINQTVKQIDTDDDVLADYKPVISPPQVSPEQPSQQNPTNNVSVDYTPGASQSFGSSGSSSVLSSNLSDRINYMIQLLEEQKDEKTGRVTEEIILYVFLGIFVIFVLDSFVKTGKYSR